MGAGDFKEYDADQVTFGFAGFILSNGGYADGVFISRKKKEKDFTSKVGTDGSVTRSKTNNQQCEITVRFMQSSQANAILSAIRQGDLATPNGAGVGPFYIKDLQGTTLFSCVSAWITNPPDEDFDREATVREWMFDTADSTIFVGGN